MNASRWTCSATCATNPCRPVLRAGCIRWASSCGETGRPRSGHGGGGGMVIGLGTSTVLFFREREARQQQTKLLAEAEKNATITRAAFLLREEKIEDANALLEQIRTPPLRPSFDGVSAFRAVGDWLVLQQRWQEAARRYAFVIHLDQLDIWGSVTLDYQAYAVLLMETGDFSTYAQFCRATAARYAEESNGDAAGRILKSCLLRPSGRGPHLRASTLGEDRRTLVGNKCEESMGGPSP